MQQKIITAEANSGSQSVRIVSPVRAIQIHAMPLDLLLPEEFGKRRIDPLCRQITVHPQRYHFLRKATNFGVFLKQCPVEPGDIVVLAKAVVVATLGAAYLVSHQQHRRTYGEQSDGQKVLHLTLAQTLDFRVVGVTFGAAVPTEIAVGTVPVPLAV